MGCCGGHNRSGGNNTNQQDNDNDNSSKASNMSIFMIIAIGTVVLFMLK